MKAAPGHRQDAIGTKVTGIPILPRRDGTMRTICLSKLSWRSYITLCTMISACIGLVLGIVLFLLVHVVHVDFSVRFSAFYIDGGLLSIVSVFIGPFVGTALGFLGAVITYPIFELMLTQFSGLPLKGTWRDSD